MNSIKIIKESEIDKYQDREGYLSQCYVHNTKNTIKISDLINGLGDIEEGSLHYDYFQQVETVFETDAMLLRKMSNVLVSLKTKYGPNVSYTINKIGGDATPTTKQRKKINENSGYFKATITIKAIRKEIIATALKYVDIMKIVGPEKMQKEFLRRANTISRLVAKNYTN